MPGNWQGWLYGVGVDGTPYELINHARTAAYLAGIGLPNGMLVCDVLSDGGCASFPYDPCGTGGDPDAYVDLPGSSGNYLSVPNSTGFDITADITVVARIALDDWTPGASSTIASKWVTTGNQRSWKFDVTTAGALNFGWTTNGTNLTFVSASSSANLSALAPGAWKWVAATLDVDNGASGRSVRFWTSDDGTTWTQLGTTQTLGTVTSVFNGTAYIRVSGLGDDTQHFAGNVSHLSVRDGIGASGVVGGTEVFAFEAEDLVIADTFMSTSGHTVTVNRSGTPDTDMVVAEGGWEPLTFANPTADNAPWYNSNEPDSGDALGFWVEEWTGLDNAHVHRNVQPRGGAGGGGRLGVLTANERVMSLNVLLFARSEAAMEHLFRWFEQTLSSVCATCATDAVLIRRFCPATTDDLWEGVVKLNDVGLISGPQWEEEPTNLGRCYLRRVNFVLAAGDPCMYGTGVTVDADATVADPVDCLASLQLGETREPCRPSCVEITEGTSCRSAFFYDVPASAATQAPVVSLTNDATEYTLPVRVIAYADPLGAETAPGVADPCALQILGEVYVRPLRPGATLVWDVGARDVLYRDHTTGHPAPGWAYVDPNDPPERRWFALPCGQVVITVEVATACLDDLGGGTYSDGAHIFLAPHYPAVTLEVVPRIGCP